MPKKTSLSAILLLSFLLAACGGKNAPAPAPTVAYNPVLTITPDPCSKENLPDKVAKIHKLTREFDDYSTLASNVQQTQLINVIPHMQRILRDAQDQTVPACLQTLKQLQLAHMETVVQTLIVFMSATDQAGAEKVNAGIAQARDLRGQYDNEMVRLTGVTPTALYGTPLPSLPTVAP
jgi:hypothetical protein